MSMGGIGGDQYNLNNSMNASFGESGVSDVTANYDNLPEIGLQEMKPRPASGWALAGRILLGIFTLGISEGIRAIVSSITNKTANPEPRLNADQFETQSEKQIETHSEEEDNFIEVQDNKNNIPLAQLLKDIETETLNCPKELKSAMSKIISDNPNLMAWEHLKDIISLGFKSLGVRLGSTKLDQDFPADRAASLFKSFFVAGPLNCLRRLGNEVLIEHEEEEAPVIKLLTLCCLKNSPDYFQAICAMSPDKLEKIQGVINTWQPNKEPLAIMQTIIELKDSMGKNSPV